MLKDVRLAKHGCTTWPEVMNKYVGQTDPTQTSLKEGLPMTSTSYEAICEGLSQSERDAFGSCQESSPRNPTISTCPELDGISNASVCEILQRLMDEDSFAYKAWDGR